MIKKLLISYSDDDRDAALRLRQTLRGAGYDVWMADKDLKGSVLWTQAILDAIDDANGVVLVWSSAAANSKVVPEEIRIARVFRKPIFPVLAHPTNRIPSLPNEIAALQVIDEGDIDFSVTELTARLSDYSKSSIEYPVLAKNGYIPKSPNPYFVGRNSELKALFVDTLGFHGQTKKGIPIAISGMAGIGKTHLALTFAYRFNLFFSDGVYWVITPNGIVQEFEKIGHYIGINRLEDERPLDYATRVKDKLEQMEKGLVIFDNVTDIAEFRKWCPEGMRSSSVILTTRKSPRGFAVRVMNLSKLDPESAFELIVSRRRDGNWIRADAAQRQALQRICDIMGNHPLALELCACYLQSEFVKPTDFLQDLEKDPLGLFADQPQFREFLGEGDVNLLEVLRRSYNSLKGENIDHYFLLMCRFAPHGINTELIMKAYGKPKEGAQALDELATNSLIYRENQEFISLHPLIVRFGRSLEQTQSGDYQKKFVEVIVEYLEANRNNLSSDQVRRELPHIVEAVRISQEKQLWRQSVQLQLYRAKIETEIDMRIGLLKEAYETIEKHSPDEKRILPEICVQLGRAYITEARFEAALVEFSKAQKLYDELQKIDPGEITALQFELGDAYLALGQHEEARKKLNSALETALNLARYDVTAPEVTRIKQALARIDLFLGSYSVAHESFRKVLEHRAEYYANHPDKESSAALASSHADLGQLALKRGNHIEAIDHVKKEALDIIKKHHKEDDPAYGNLYLLLGTIITESGEYKLAEEQIERARQIFLRIFGEVHPSYARTFVALGEVDRRLVKFRGALEKIEKATKIFENRYGKDHPSVAEALEIKGKIHGHLCEFDEGERVWERVLMIQKEAYSANPNHPVLAATHYDYGSLFLQKGEFAKAREHLEESLRITKESLGTEHPEYYGRFIRLATCYYEEQNYSKAAAKLEEARGLQDNIFGDSPHPYIARMYQLESEIQRRLGNFKAASVKIDEAIKMKEKIYGKDHPSVAEALEIKGKIHDHLCEFGEEERVWERVLRIQKEAYSANPNHPALARTHCNCGHLYRQKGEFAKAREQLEVSLRIIDESLGKTHPCYFCCLIRLATCYYEEQNYSEAAAKLEEARGLQDNIFGDSPHPYIARMYQLESEIQRRLGNFKAAGMKIDEAIKMKEGIYGKDHPSVAEALEIKGKVHDHLCEFDEEGRVWERVLGIQKKAYSANPNHPALATTHYDYGSLFLHKGEFAKAREQLDESLRITKESLGIEHPEYYGRLIRLATCYYEEQNYSEAEKRLKEAETLQNKIFGKSSHPYVARKYQLESEIQRRLGNFKTAGEKIDEAIKMKEELYGKDHPSVAEALEIKGKIHDHLCEFDEEGRVWERVLGIQKKAYSANPNHPALATTHYDYGSLFLHKGEFAKAREQLDESLRITKESLGIEHPEYYGRLIRLATCYYEEQNYIEAEKRLKEAETLQNKVFGKSSHPYVARKYQLESEIQRRLGNFKAAGEKIDEAIKMKEELYGKDHPSVAEALEIKGKILDHLSEFDEEEKVWERVLGIQEKAYKANPNHPALAATHYDYGSLFLHKGEFAKAREQLEESLRITKESLGTEHPEYYGRLIGLANCYYEKQNYFEATAKLEEAQGLQEKVFRGSPHSYIARMLQLESVIQRRLGNFTVAGEKIDEAIMMKEKIYGKDHPSVAEALEIKVDLNLNQFRTRESNILLEILESIRRKAYGEKHPEFANYQMRMAEYYSISGHYEKAQDMLKQSLQTCVEKFSSEHREIIKRQVMSARLARIAGDIVAAEMRINDAIKALGGKMQTEKSTIISSVLTESAYIKRKQGNYKTSLAEFERAIEIESEISGPKSPGVIELLINKVKLQIVLNLLKEAESTIEHAMTCANAEGAIYKRLMGDLLDQRGILETYMNKPDKAIKSFDVAIELKRDVLGDNNVELAKLFVDKAVALRIRGNYKEAFSNLQDAQNIDNLHFGENHVFFAKIFLERGRTYHCTKNYLAAREQLVEALEIYREQPDQDPRDHAIASEALGLVHLEAGFAFESSKLLGDALKIKRAIYDSQHPEIAETLYDEARALIKRAGTGESHGELIESARLKLKEALQILKGNEENVIKLRAVIESTLSTL